MFTKSYSLLGFIVLITSVLISCVSPRIVDDLKKKNERCEVDNSTLKTENEKLTTSNTEMSSTIKRANKELRALERDTSIMGTSLSKMVKNYDQINELYELLLQKNRELLAGNVSQTNQLMTKLQMTEEDLQKREDELRLLERSLNQQQRDIDKLRADLEEREKRVNELEKIIADQEAAVTDLKNKVVAALRGFENKGLTIEERNGKVYVSLEAKLLFPSGSIVVDKKGKGALVKLAKVLEDNKDINIMVEGHTDTDKYGGGTGAIKDNWDLSVLRATSVVKILQQNSNIDPMQITAAGRSEYIPVDASNKAKNRRIEVILSPNLDELFKLLGE